MKRLLLILIFTLSLLSPQRVVALPNLDGVISNGEWSSGSLKQIEMNNGQILSLTTIYTINDIYFLATLDHNTASDEIILDVSGPHDYFGIEFDNNQDDVIMGTPSSPDDMVIVDYIEKGAVDMYSHTFRVREDNKNEGQNDVQGSSGSKDGTIIWEMKKPLNSGDLMGYDISLETGSKYKIMVAFWDNKLPHSAAGFVNKAEGNTQFITMIVGSPIDRTIGEVIGGIAMISSLGFSILIMNYGMITPEKIKRIITK